MLDILKKYQSIQHQRRQLNVIFGNGLRQLGVRNGRTRTAMYTDSIEQLCGTAGARQVRVRAETALAAFTTPSSGGWIMFGKYPS
jgi:hypothetical protein